MPRVPSAPQPCGKSATADLSIKFAIGSVAPPGLPFVGHYPALSRLHPSPGATKVMNDRPKAGCCKFQSGEGDGQLETAWPGASRIQIEHTVDRFDPRSMRVAGNDHVDSANCWINLQLLNVVQDIEGPLAEPYHL